MLLRTPRLIDQTAFMHRVRDLNDKARSAYWELSLHYWERGRLPNADRDLAAVCKLPVVSFRNLRIQIGWAFDDTDAEGRWRDYELEAERDDAIRALGLDPAAFREPAPVSAPAGGAEESRSPKSLAGSLNARKRWARVAAERVSRDADGIGSASAAVPNAMPTAVPNEAAGMVDGIAVARPGVAVASSEKEEDSLDSVSSSSSVASQASEADANSHPACDAKPPASGASHAARATLSRQAGTLDLVALEQKHGVTGDEIRRVVLDAIGADKIGFDLASAGAIDPLWRLLEEGCDLRRDIAPALTYCRSLRSKLSWLGADFIAPRCRANRDRPGRPASAGAVIAAGGLNNVWIPAGSAMEKAWKAYEQGRPDAGKWLNQQYAGKDRRFSGTRGWWRASEWPPGHAAAMAREQEDA